MGDISKNYGGDQNIGLFSRAPVAADKRFPVGYLWIDTSVSPRKSYVLLGIVGGLGQWSTGGGGSGTGSGLSEYLQGTTYLSGDIVNYLGTLYKCIAVSSIGEQPDLFPAVWELYNSKVSFTSITDPSKGVSATMLLPIKTHIDSVAHGLIAGTKVRFVGGDLPAPLAELTDYTVCLAPGADWFEVETIALTPIQLTTDGSGDYMVVQEGPCTMTGATDLVNAVAHPMLDGDIVQFTGVDLPVELALLTDYYVISKNADDFQIALAAGGVPIEFSDSGAGMDVAFHQKTSTPVAFSTTLVNSKIHKVATTMINNDTVQFTGLLLPPELVAGTTYYVVNKTADDFEVAPGLGGVAIDFSVAGSGKYHLMNQALTAAILDAYDGTVITLTEAPAVAQTLQTPTASDKVFVVVNSKTSTHSISVFDNLNETIIEPGTGVKYFWDGSSWNVLEGMDAGAVNFTPYGFITSADVQKAIEAVVDEFANKVPYVNAGPVEFNTAPVVGDNVEGKVFWDATFKTLAAHLPGAVTVQIGQETMCFVYNNTGAVLASGKPVYISGATAGGIPQVTLASNISETTSFVLGLVTSSPEIAVGGYGFVTIRGHVNEVNTDLWNVNDSLYLGETAGTLTNVPPSEGKYDVRIGRVMIKDAVNGRVYVNVRPMSRLTDLGDVTIANPITDEVLRYNGTEWVNGSPTSVSAGPGIEFFPDDTAIVLGGGASTENKYPVKTLSKTPITSAEDVDSIVANNTTAMYGAYLYNTALGRTLIDAGVWTFDVYTAVDSGTGTTTLKQNINRVRSASGTITIVSNPSTTIRTATASEGTPFAAADINVGGTLDSDSFLQTPAGLFRILSRVSDVKVTINTLSTYTNEVAVAFSVHKRLFQIVTPEINNTATAPLYAGLQLYTVSTAQPAYVVLATDKLSNSFFATTTSNRTVYFSHNGTSRYSHFTTPLITLHNNLAGLDAGDYRHLTLAEYNANSSLVTFEEDIIPVDFMEDGAVAPDASELYTNTLAKVRVRKFSGVANQDLYFNWPVPEKIDVSVGIRFAVEFIVSEATGPNVEKVSFTLAGYSVRNGDNTTGAFGGAVASNLGSTTANQHSRFLTAKSATITITDLAVSELAFMNFIRDAVGADDTYAQKVAVVGLRIYWSKLKT